MPLFEMEATIPADKGQANGICSNEWCQTRPAIYEHKQNGGYYCRKCANQINKETALYLQRPDAPDVCVANIQLTAPARVSSGSGKPA